MNTQMLTRIGCESIKSLLGKVAFRSAKVAQCPLNARYFRRAKGDYDKFTA